MHSLGLISLESVLLWVTFVVSIQLEVEKETGNEKKRKVIEGCADIMSAQGQPTQRKLMLQQNIRLVSRSFSEKE